MIVTTTPGIDGRNVERYLSIVTGEAILGANIFRDMFANIRDLVGGRSAAYEKELGEARSIALQEMMERGQQMGANAIVGSEPGLRSTRPSQRDADGYRQWYGCGGEIGACRGVTYAQRTACFDKGVLLV